MLSLEGRSDWMFSYVYPCQENVKANSSFHVDNSRIVYVREDGRVSNIYIGKGELKPKGGDVSIFKSDEKQETIKNETENTFVKVIPNPNNGNFKFISNLTNDVQVIMVDLLGNIVYQDDYQDGSIDNAQINNIPNGVYIVQIYQNNQLLFREKVIVN